MIKNFVKFLIYVLSMAVLLTLSSCQDITQADYTQRTPSSVTSGADGNTRVYKTNPVVLTGSTTISAPSWSKLLSYGFITTNPYLEETCSFKQENYVEAVETPLNCLAVYKNNQANQISKNGAGWNYSVDSDEFYQVNTFYHVKKIMDRFFKTLEFSHYYTHMGSSLYIPPATKYNLAATQAFWLGQNGNAKTFKVYTKCEFEGHDINAFFNPAQDNMCLGWNANLPRLYMAQDPSVIYHEMGHAFVKIMMNQRNTVDTGTLIDNYLSVDFKSDLGTLSYDEAGAINEGLADFFAYYITGRKYVGEWAMDRIPFLLAENAGYVGVKYGRPMDEEDASHMSGISSSVPGEKLSYPQYINYNPHTPSNRFEGEIHYAGQIISHYLVRLSETFKTSCTLPTLLKNKVSDDNEIDPDHFASSSMVLLLLNETLAELGDMTAKGSDYFNEYAITGSGLANVFFTNLNADEAFLWGHQVTPPDMRRFFKLFAKNIKYYISDPFSGLCPQFSVDDSETLLDEYGLLLFKSYGDAGQGLVVDGSGNVSSVKYEDYDGNYLLGLSSFSASSNSSEVNELNRKQTILVSKNYLDLPTDGRATAYVFDGKSEIEGMLASITFEGNPVATSTGLADVNYNNDNIKISPGEIVGVALNLVNNSNSVMAGVQILANDWDHMKLQDDSKLFVNRQENLFHSTYMNQIATWEPCQIDGWPTDTEGGVIWDSSTAGNEGDCQYTTRNNKQFEVETSGTASYPFYKKDAPQPICLVQYSDENETKWVSQDYFRKYVLGLEDHECLNNESSGVEFNPNECLIRVLPGANQAVYSHMKPQKTWLETVSENNPSPQHSSSNVVLMEVNKWIQPGTNFNCRFRARFTNCQDCFNDNNSGEDFEDYEYAGMEPYKVINFSFKVID